MSKKRSDGHADGNNSRKSLETRHVFLDTQVYRNFGHNRSNPALKLIKEHVEAHRIVLHISDITLLEIQRQIRELVISRQQDLAKIEKDLGRWRRSAPSAAPSAPISFETDRLAKELFARFAGFLLSDCQAYSHKALDVAPTTIFELYFARQAPFDGLNSKEFPDAFVLAALIAWCEAREERLYVVTEDKAMGRAVEASDPLIYINDIHDLLARIGADFGAEGEKAAEDAMDGSDFDQTFEDALREEMGDVVFLYAGDLAEGEAYQGSLSEIGGLVDWSVVWLSDERVSLIIDVNAKVSVEVQYEDRRDAFYDKEDDVWFGAETTSADIESSVDFEVFVELERGSGKVRECRVVFRLAKVTPISGISASKNDPLSLRL